MEYAVLMKGDESLYLTLNRCVLSDTCNQWIIGFLAYWNGPRRKQMIFDWWKRCKKGMDESLIMMALTGLNPKTEGVEWVAEIKRAILKEKHEFNGVEQIIRQNMWQYEFIFSVAFASKENETFDTHWELLLQELRKQQPQILSTPKQIPISTQVQAIQQREGLESSLVHSKDSQRKITVKNKNERVESTKHSNIHGELEDTIATAMDWTDADSAKAPEIRLNINDQKVQTESTWSKYLKPFLSENILGIIGVFSFLLAWMFIGEWFLDKGEVYRILFGAVPLALLSLGLAKCCHFFSQRFKLEELNGAVAITAILSFLIWPFNFLLGFGAINIEGVFGTVIAIGLPLLYFGLIILVAHWVSDPFGKQSRLFFLFHNGLFFLSGLLMSWSSNQTESFNQVLVNSYLFVGLLPLLYFMRGKHIENISGENKGSSFSYIAGGLFYLLTLSILMANTHKIPSTSMFGILAILVSYFICRYHWLKKYNPSYLLNIILTIGAYALCSLDSLELLLVNISSIYIWWMISRSEKISWTNDALILQMLMLPIAGVLFFNINSEFWLFVFIVGLIAAQWVESIIIRKESKLLTWLALLSLISPLLHRYFFMQDGTYDYLIYIILVTAICVWNYMRSVHYYRKINWTITSAAFFVLPAFYFVYDWSGNLNNSLFSLATCLLLWSSLRNRVNDLFMIKKGFSVFCSALVATCILFIIATISGQIVISNSLGAGVVFDTSTSLIVVGIYFILSALLIYAARKTTSSIPVYLFFLMIGVGGFQLKNILGLSSQTGIGTASASLFLFFLSVWVVNGVSPSKTLEVRLFKIRFPMVSDNYLNLPLLQVATLFSVLGLVKAALNFEPLIQLLNGGTGLSLSILVSLLISLLSSMIIARHIGWKLLGYWSLFPAVLIVYSLLTLSYGTLLGHFTIITLAGILISFEYFRHKLSVENIFLTPVKQLLKIFVFLSIPISYLYYLDSYLLSNTSLWLLVSYWLLVTAYLHYFFVVKTATEWAHLNWLHFFIVVTLILNKLIFNDLLLDKILFDKTMYLTSIFNTELIAFIAGVGLFSGGVLEIFKRPNTSRYVSTLFWWLLAIAMIFVIAMINSLTVNALELNSIAMFILLAHWLSRYRDLLVFRLSKLIAISLYCVLLLDSFFTGVAVGLVLFTSLEWLFLLSGKFFRPIVSVSSPKTVKDIKNIHLSMHVGWYGLLLAHIVSWLLSSSPVTSGIVDLSVVQSSVNHNWLYLLMPMAYLIYRISLTRYMQYMVLLSFVYANIFTALKWLPEFTSHDLNFIHLFTSTIFISFFIFWSASKVIVRFERRATL